MMAVTPDVLRKFEPLAILPEERLLELARLCDPETLPPGENPFHAAGPMEQCIYLLRGAVEIVAPDGKTRTIRAGTAQASHPLGREDDMAAARTLEESELIGIDDELLDIMLTWSLMAEVEAPRETDAGRKPAQTSGPAQPSVWKTLSGIFNLTNLTAGLFASLPTAHVGELLRRFQPIQVLRGDLIIREGDEGDYYYMIELGRAEVTREVGGATMALADLRSGDAFGEEALIAGTRRNASVRMKTDGCLLRLAKHDFDELLKKPLLMEVGRAEAERRATQGALWLDVRFPSEYQHDRIPGAINIPLGELRHAFGALDKDIEYLVYCQSGRRSAAAAFLLAQRGFRAVVLAGGLKGSDPVRQARTDRTAIAKDGS